MSRHLMLFLAGALVVVAAALLAAQSTPRGPVDYDTFWKLDVEGRLRLFNEVTPENRADLVREQVRRWLDANRARLNADQIKLLDEVMSAITPDVYRLPRQPEAVERMKALEARAAALLSREDAGDALTIQGPYVPKKK